MNYTVESIQETISQLNGFTDRIASIEEEIFKARRATMIYKVQTDQLEEEIQKRLANPANYPIGAGAGTVDECRTRLSDWKNKLDEWTKEYEENTSALDDAEEDLDQYQLILSQNYDVNKLVDMRREIGKEMSKHFRLQKESYELQKERYENCKNTFGFRDVDRMFIDEHKQKVREHKNIWIKLCDDRELICKLINVLDPSDMDPGFDEQEDIDTEDMEDQDY